jgi:hypothetical protein
MRGIFSLLLLNKFSAGSRGRRTKDGFHQACFVKLEAMDTKESGNKEETFGMMQWGMKK